MSKSTLHQKESSEIDFDLKISESFDDTSNNYQKSVSVEIDYEIDSKEEQDGQEGEEVDEVNPNPKDEGLNKNEVLSLFKSSSSSLSNSFDSTLEPTSAMEMDKNKVSEITNKKNETTNTVLNFFSETEEENSTIFNGYDTRDLNDYTEDKLNQIPFTTSSPKGVTRSTEGEMMNEKKGNHEKEEDSKQIGEGMDLSEPLGNENIADELHDTTVEIDDRENVSENSPIVNEESTDEVEKENDWIRFQPTHEKVEPYFEAIDSPSPLVKPLPQFQEEEEDEELKESSISSERSRSNYQESSPTQTPLTSSKEEFENEEIYESDVDIESENTNAPSNVNKNKKSRQEIAMNFVPTKSLQEQRRSSAPVNSNFSSNSNTSLNWTSSVPTKIPFRTTKKLESRNRKIMKSIKEIDQKIAVHNGTSTARRSSQPNLHASSSISEQQKSIDRLYRMAVDMKNSKESRRESLKVQQELQGCTFRPRIIKSNHNNQASNIRVENRLMSAKDRYETKRRASIQAQEEIEKLRCPFSPDTSISMNAYKAPASSSNYKEPLHNRLYKMGTQKLIQTRRGSATTPPDCTFSPVLDQTKKFNDVHLSYTSSMTPDQRREQLYQYGKLKINHEREIEDSKKPAKKLHNDDHLECTFYPLTNHARGRELYDEVMNAQEFYN